MLSAINKIKWNTSAQDRIHDLSLFIGVQDLPTTFSHSNVHSQMMSKSLEDAIRDYSRFLVDLPTLTTTDEIEYAQLELQELLSRHSKDARRYEQATIQKLAYLVSLYAKKRIVEKGIDTCGKGVLVDFEDSHYTF